VRPEVGKNAVQQHTREKTTMGLKTKTPIEGRGSDIETWKHRGKDVNAALMKRIMKRGGFG